MVVLSPANALFCRLFLGDVAHRHDDAAILLVCLVRAPCVDRDPAFPSVVDTHNPKRGIRPMRLTGPDLLDIALELRPVFGMDALEGHLELSGRVGTQAEDFEQTVRPFTLVEKCIIVPNAQPRCLGRETAALLAFAARLRSVTSRCAPMM